MCYRLLSTACHAGQRSGRTQSKMVRGLIGCRVREGEDSASFVQRRNRLASTTARRHGTWSKIWAKKVTDWNSHLQRDRNRHSWAAKVLRFHGAQWLQDQRRIHAVGQQGSLVAGRTCTRAFPGIVHRRWHDGVDVAGSFHECRLRIRVVYVVLQFASSQWSTRHSK